MISMNYVDLCLRKQFILLTYLLCPLNEINYLRIMLNSNGNEHIISKVSGHSSQTQQLNYAQ